MIDFFSGEFQKVLLVIEKRSLLYNKITTLIYFILLMLVVFFIQMHPHSVWYYFIAGYFSNRMVCLILEKTQIKNRIDQRMKQLIRLGHTTWTN